MTIAVDCGANIGLVTQELAQKYDQVWAFEPNRFAFRRLCENCHRFPNVNLVHAAVVPSTHGSPFIKIYLDKRAVDQPFETKVKYSQASSIFKSKGNVTEKFTDDVLAVDFSAFINGLDCVDYIKMDVEGAEYGIICDLIEKDLMSKIGQLNVELHARKYPCFQVAHAKLAKLAKEKNITNIGYHH